MSPVGDSVTPWSLALRRTFSFSFSAPPHSSQMGRGVTHARTAGCRGRGAVRAVGGPVMRSGRPGRRVSELAFSASGAAYPNRSGQYARCNLMLRAANSCEPVPQSARGRRGTSMRGAGPRRQRHKSASSGLAQAWESNPRQTVYETVALPTELTCWRPRPRHRAVHARAIRSASAPGGTRESAPLTRFPSQTSVRRCPFGQRRILAESHRRKRRDPGQQSQPGSLVRVPGGLC